MTCFPFPLYHQNKDIAINIKKMTDILEKGPIYYFYRPKVEAETSRDIQQFMMVLKNSDIYRLIIIGAKELLELKPE